MSITYPISGNRNTLALPILQHYVDASGNARPIGVKAYAYTTKTLTGASDQLLAANTGRRALIVTNPAGNSAATVDITGGAATTSRGISLPAGSSLVLTDADCPTGVITANGTNTNVLGIYEGT